MIAKPFLRPSLCSGRIVTTGLYLLVFFSVLTFMPGTRSNPAEKPSPSIRSTGTCSRTGDLYPEHTSAVLSSKKIRDNTFTGSAVVEPLKSMNGYRLSLRDSRGNISDQVRIPFPVYRLETGDIDGNGRTDILLGVVKSTHFDAHVKRRLFVYQIQDGRLMPLWLGSRVCRELVDFTCIVDQRRPKLLTVERTSDANFSNGVYTWEDFGFILERYIHEHSDATAAEKYLETRSR